MSLAGRAAGEVGEGEDEVTEQENKAEGRGAERDAAGRDADLDALVEKVKLWTERFEPEELSALCRLAKEARYERDTWKHLEGVEPTALRIRAEQAEADLAALREAIAFLLSVIACGEELSEEEQQQMRALARGSK